MGAERKDQQSERRVVLVEDHPMMRERLAELLRQEPDLCVCGEAEDHAPALEIIEKTQPQLVIVDLTLKTSNGLDLIKDLHARRPDMPILVVSMHDEAMYGERVLRAGARGFVSKQESSATVREAIQTVLRGDLYLSDRLSEALTAKIAGRSRHHAGMSVDTLTDRELRVFELLGRGLTTRQVAKELGLNMRTVETYRARIKRKLHLKNGNELTHLAVRWTEGGAR